MEDLQFFKEVLPEERLAKVIKALAGINVDFTTISLGDLAALLSPYVQIETEESSHQERVICLSYVYAMREKMMERERKSFQKKADLFLIISNRPEADKLGLHLGGIGQSAGD